MPDLSHTWDADSSSVCSGESEEQHSLNDLDDESHDVPGGPAAPGGTAAPDETACSDSDDIDSPIAAFQTSQNNGNLDEHLKSRSRSRTP